MPKNQPAVVTYLSADGACAAAMMLLKHPDAAVITSSANRIGETFQALLESHPSSVHVCGVGVYCEWSELEQAAETLRENGTEIFWHCGRGYLDQEKASFEAFCIPVFQSAGTNTEAVARHFGLRDRPDAQFLINLAWFDHNVPGAKPQEELTREQADWLDFIEAAMSNYFKYQDLDPYAGLIRKLARQELSPKDHLDIEAFRRAGYRYVLHGVSPVMRALKRRIQKCAEVNRHVIITGESGVGKEHVAHLLWERSRQSSGPFVPVNCAMYAGNSNLANSDLFGHVKGAYTGAVSNRKGRFIEADGGILFLDELGELPLEVQAKLLRIIEDGWVTPEGADKPEKHVNVRIVAATNLELPRLIRAGGFRADLFHRLSTLRISVPPLRERPEDIDAIVKERLILLEREGRSPKLKKADFKILHGYDWPGNVRQLIKVLERAVLLDISIEASIEEERELSYATQWEDGDGVHQGPLYPADTGHVLPMKKIQRLYARNVWELCERNYTAAAKLLEVNPNTLRYTYLSRGN